MVDLTVERMQNRQGLKLHLPQPLRPGEYGFCTDTKELFIGGDPINMSPGVQIITGDYATAQSLINNQILVASTDGTFTGVDSIISAVSSYASADDNVFYITETAEVYIGASLAEMADVQDAIDFSVGDPGTGVTGVTGSVIGLSNLIDIHGGIVFAHHSEANAVAAILNNLSPVPMALTKLNVEVITEFSDWNTDPQADRLFNNPITISLPPQVLFTDIPPLPGQSYPALAFDATNESDTVIIDYSISYDEAPNHYRSNGTLTITTNVSMGTTTIVDENSELLDPLVFPYTIDFEAGFIPAAGSLPDTVIVRYRHDFITQEPLMKAITKRWRSF